MRFIDLGVVTPEFSVCADRVLLDSHRSGDDDVLLVYSRDRPCISVGRFQRTEDTVNIGHVKKKGISMVRRVSGGSNIYSDENQLTYSLIISRDRLPASRNDSFAVICNALVASLRRLGVDGYHKPVNDVLVNGKKISGGAQARSRSAVLQHGSIILDVDNDAVTSSLNDRKKRSYDGLTSVKECLGHMPSRDVIVDSIIAGFSEAFGPIVKGCLGNEEVEMIQRSADLLLAEVVQVH
ncbi:MAG: lipoate--protein ligase family protein [Methanomassiliicoccaceae archaeon]|jgi:lipoate-protein ligase A|nr:lipoate--protein ligase family protein [Methanomassiliicoccaceae archaeon]